MKNQRFVRSRVLALLLPATLGLGCGLKRDWSICAPNDKQKCLPGYVCTPDLRCVLAGDGGSDALLAGDSREMTDTAADAVDRPLPPAADAPVAATPVWDAGESDLIASWDGALPMDGPHPIDGTSLPDSSDDRTTQNADQAPGTNPDGAGGIPDAPSRLDLAAVDVSVDAPIPDAVIADGLSCTAGIACQPSSPCETGTTSCMTGASVCVTNGSRAAGATCGTGMVCDGSGTCVACSQGGACTPQANLCHKGTYACATGHPICVDSGTSVADGTNCGHNLFCRGGACLTCLEGGPCQPTNPCKTGTYSCATGSAVCTETGNQAVDLPCGAGQSCTNGTKTLAAACNASGQCVSTPVACPFGCNGAGTDCAICPAGQTSCPNGCKSLTNDPSNCAACGLSCPQPLGGTGSGLAVCAGSQCGASCNAGFLKCAGSTAYCQRSTWDFEDGTAGGFGILRTDYTMAAVTVTSSAAQHHAGSRSIAIPLTVHGTVRGFEIGLTLCGGAVNIPLAGLTSISAWFFVEGPALDASSYFGEAIYTDKALAAGNIPYSSLVGQWFQVSTLLNSFSASSTLGQVGVQGYVNGITDWTGTVYVDDITIQ